LLQNDVLNFAFRLSQSSGNHVRKLERRKTHFSKNIWSILPMRVKSLVVVVAPRRSKIIKNGLIFLKEETICYKMVYFILCLG